MCVRGRKVDLGAAIINSSRPAQMGSGALRDGPRGARFFYPKEGEAGWLIYLFLLPAYSCIAYSIGMARRGWAGGCLRNDLP